MKTDITLVDSHCHLDQLDLSPYEGSLDAVLKEAATVGVSHMLCVCIDMNNFPNVLAIAKKYPHIKASVGLHPNEPIDNEPSEEHLKTLAQDPNIIAIGETGLDYFRSEGDLTWQQERFRRHIRVAKAVKKPLIIHTREAKEDTLRIMKEENAAEIGGVLHCFTEDWAMASAAMEQNFYISFSGIVTFKSATTLQEVAKKIPLDRMLIETDAPYLAPMPHRGKSNVPAYVRYVAEYIAQLRNVPLKLIAQHTTDNYFSLFNTKPVKE